MARRKAGLHKELSAILNGISIPKENDVQRPSDTATPEGIGYAPAKPLTPASNKRGLTPEPQIPPMPKPQPPVQTAPTPKPQPPVQTAPMPKPRQPEQAASTPKPPPAWSLPKAIPPNAVEKLRQQQAKANGITKLFRQIPWQIFHSRASRV